MPTPEDSSSLPDVMTGARGDYRWLTSTFHTIDSLLTLCPELVLGRYLAVTSCDSGPLRISETLGSSGWQSLDGIAYSPRITSFELLPPHALYDEWYVLQAPGDLGGVATAALGTGTISVFVNNAQFIFDPGNESLADEFWRQIDWMRPYAYVSEFDSWWLTVVCNDQALFAAVEEKLRLSVH